MAWLSKVPKEWIADVEERDRLDEIREKGRRRSSVEMIKGVFGEEKGKVGGASCVRGKRRGGVVWRVAIIWPPFSSPCTASRPCTRQHARRRSAFLAMCSWEARMATTRGAHVVGEEVVA